MSTVISCGNELLTGSGAQLIVDLSAAGDLTTTWPDDPVVGPLTIRSMNDWQYDLPVIDNSTLLTPFYDETIPGDRIRLDPIEMEIVYSTEDRLQRDDTAAGALGKDYRVDDQALFASLNGSVPVGKNGILYLYFPGTAPATGAISGLWYLRGCGFVRNWRMPRMEANVRQIGRAQVQFSNRANAGSRELGIDPQPKWYQVP